MISFEKLLYLTNKFSPSEAKDYLAENGFILQSDYEGNQIWIKPLNAEKAEVISFTQIDGLHKSVSYIFFDEETYFNLLEKSAEELGFQILENGITKVLGTEDHILIATKRPHTHPISFSVKLATRNKDSELIKEVIINPPT